MRRGGWKAALLLCLLTAPAWGQFRLTVGRGGQPWTEIADSSSLVEVAPDSIWIWPVIPRENLAANARTRGGDIYASGIRQVEVAPASFTDERFILATRAVEAMVDGDPATAFDPDAAGVEREVEVYLDLGGTFQISRVRLFPRLDEKHRNRFPQTFELGLGGASRRSASQPFTNRPSVPISSTSGLGHSSSPPTATASTTSSSCPTACSS